MLDTEIAIKGAACDVLSFPFGTLVVFPKRPGNPAWCAVFNFCPDKDGDAEGALKELMPAIAESGASRIRLFVAPDIAGEADASRLDEDLFILGFTRADLRIFAWVKTVKKPVAKGIQIAPLDWEGGNAAPLYDGEGVSAGENGRLRIHRTRDENLPGYKTYAASIKGEPAGRLALYNGGVAGRLRSLYVRPEHRRKGVGSALVLHNLALARDAGAVVCGLIMEKDSPARYMFVNLGFADIGELRRYEGAVS